MKRKLLISAVLVICIAIISAGSIAFFNSEATARNVITMGDISIAIHEWADEDCKTEWTDATGVMPGSEVTKVVKIENLTESEAWVRVRVDRKLTLSDGTEGRDPELIKISFNTEESETGGYWIDGNDGYYYYSEKVTKSDSMTTPVFTTVTFDETMGDEYQGSRADVIVYAQAVQAKNNGSTALEAEGWPAQADLNITAAAIQ